MCRTVKGCYGYADVGGYMCEKKEKAQQQKKKKGERPCIRTYFYSDRTRQMPAN